MLTNEDIGILILALDVYERAHGRQEIASMVRKVQEIPDDLSDGLATSRLQNIMKNTEYRCSKLVGETAIIKGKLFQMKQELAKA